MIQCYLTHWTVYQTEFSLQTNLPDKWNNLYLFQNVKDKVLTIPQSTPTNSTDATTPLISSPLISIQPTITLNMQKTLANTVIQPTSTGVVTSIGSIKKVHKNEIHKNESDKCKSLYDCEIFDNINNILVILDDTLIRI